MGSITNKEWNALQKLVCSDGKTGHIQFVIPKSLQPTVLKNFHDVPSACQLEADRMVLKNSTIFLLASNEIDNREL